MKFAHFLLFVFGLLSLSLPVVATGTFEDFEKDILSSIRAELLKADGQTVANNPTSFSKFEKAKSSFNFRF
jgi:hypothetical protein